MSLRYLSCLRSYMVKILSQRYSILAAGVFRTVMRSQSGFNMIELMVGMAIVAIVLFVGVPSMGTWLQTSQIRNAAESIQGGLQLARAEAVGRNTNVQFSLTSVAAGGTASDWRVDCVAAPPACPAVTLIQQRFATEGSPNAQVTLDPTSSPLAVPGTVTFNSLGRMVIPAAPPTSEYRFIVTNPTGGTCAAVGGNMRCLGIGVSSGGLVRMCDPAFPPGTNPRAC
jgi:type IV fimbrial biogenesis protein FimT